jgi:tripartite-type tricarboxylate transporter receptor subunit TctC
MKISKALVLAAGVFAGAAFAQDNWPESRPIRIVQAFSPGAATHALAQDVGEVLSKAYKAQYFVEAKPGAGGVIGTEYASKMAPDGYTLLLGTAGTHAINPSLYSKLPYNPSRDFEPITLLADLPNVLIVPKNSPFNSVRDVIAAAKAQPGKLNYGSSGNGTSMHLAGEQFKAAAGTDIAHVPFKESAHALTALMGGEIQLTFHQLSAVLSHIKAGNVKALGVTSAQRVPALPDVPTVAEGGGLPGFESVTWFAMFAPKGTPKPVIDKVNQAVVTALRADLGKKIVANGSSPRPSTPGELAQAITKDQAQWKAVIDKAGVRLD